MPSLRFNPSTGQYEYKDANQVVNETTGQTAGTISAPNTITQTTPNGVSTQVATPTPVTTQTTPKPSPTPTDNFNVSLPEDGISSDVLGGTNTVADSVNSVKSLLNQFNADVLAARDYVDPNQQAISQIRESLNNIQVESDLLDNEQLTSDEDVLAAQAKAEQRQVDIGTIQGQQNQIGRIAEFGDRDRRNRGRDLAVRRNALTRQLGTYLDASELEIQRLQTNADISQSQLNNFMAVSEFIKNNTDLSMPDSARQAAILGVYSKGIFNPADIFKAVNFDENGVLVGDISVQEISDVLTLLNGEPVDVISALDQAKLDIDRQKLALDQAKFAHDKTKPDEATNAETVLANYAFRLEQSNPIISQHETAVQQYNPAVYEAARLAAETSNVFNPAIPDDLQSIFQAQRNFLNAVLRRESGAVISPSEFAEGARQYFPLPSDSDEVLAQKRATRDLVTRNFIDGAGSAYTNLSVPIPTSYVVKTKNGDIDLSAFEE